MADYKNFKEYYQDPEFRKKLLEYKNTRITCECGSETTKANMSHHKQTAKHTKWISQNGDLRQIEIDNLKKRLTSLENKFESLFNYKPSFDPSFGNISCDIDEIELEEI